MTLDAKSSFLTLSKINDAKPPANPPIIIFIGCAYILQSS